MIAIRIDTLGNLPMDMDYIDLNAFSIIVALLAQAAGVVWWAATINRRMADLESNLDTVKSEQQTLGSEQRNQERALNSISTTMARLDERTGAMASSLTTNFDHITTRLNNLDARLASPTGK